MVIHIQEMVNRTCERLASGFVDTGRVLTLDSMFVCLTGDVISNFAFGQCQGFINALDLKLNSQKPLKTWKT